MSGSWHKTPIHLTNHSQTLISRLGIIWFPSVHIPIEMQRKMTGNILKVRCCVGG